MIEGVDNFRKYLLSLFKFMVFLVGRWWRLLRIKIDVIGSMVKEVFSGSLDLIKFFR